MKKRLFGIVLSLMLVATMIPAMAFANGQSDQSNTNGDSQVVAPAENNGDSQEGGADQNNGVEENDAVNTPISKISATIKAPVVGEKPSRDATITTDPTDAALPDIFVDWYYWGEVVDPDGESYVGWVYIDLDGDDKDYVFEKGKTYAVDIYADPEEGFDFNEETVGSINGMPHDRTIWDDPLYLVDDNGYGYVCISAQWKNLQPVVAQNTADKSPKTGDYADMAIWIALMVIAAAAGTGTVLYRRKNTVK